MFFFLLFCPKYHGFCCPWTDNFIPFVFMVVKSQRYVYWRYHIFLSYVVRVDWYPKVLTKLKFCFQSQDEVNKNPIVAKIKPYFGLKQFLFF